jgi:hypothetical protein
MKKLLFLFTTLLLISCSSDENEESTQTFLEKYNGYFFIQENQGGGNSDGGYYFTNSEIYMNWVSINDGCNECYPYEDIKNQELKCPDHDLGSQNVNEVGYCKIVENSSAKLIEDCIECVDDNLDSVDNITTFEYVVVDDELRVTSISKNSEGSTIGTNFEIYIKTSQPFSCECNE